MNPTRLFVVIGVVILVAAGIFYWNVVARHNFVDARVIPDAVSLCPNQSESLTTEVQWDDQSWHPFTASKWESDEPQTVEVTDEGQVKAVVERGSQVDVTATVSRFEKTAVVTVEWPNCGPADCGIKSNDCGWRKCGTPTGGVYYIPVDDADAVCDAEHEAGDWDMAWRGFRCVDDSPLDSSKALVCVAEGPGGREPRDTCECG